MNLYVSHMSAMRYWRQSEGLATSLRTKARSLANAMPSVKDARKLRPREHGLIMSEQCPLDVLVGNKDVRRYATEFRPHLWTGDVPVHAFRKIAPSLYISTPEFVFLQLAPLFSVEELAQIGNELCGGYYLLGKGGFKEHEDLRTLTTRAKLAEFVSRMHGARGTARARQALRWVADNCNSPQETNSLLALCLPRRRGGWSLFMPEVNKSVSVGKRLARYVGGETYTPDFMWERTVGGKVLRITGEYDSHEHHDEDSAAEKTRIRRNDMKAMGYLVTSINRSQLRRASEFRYPARQIARDLGLYRPVPDEETLSRQDELLTLLRRERFR